MAAARIDLAPELSEVARMNAWYDALVAGQPPVRAGDMKLCLNEAVANVLSYGLDGIAAPAISVEMTVEADALHAVVTDNGIAFDPLAAPLAEPLDDLETAGIGGFGIKLMRETASGIAYRREDGRNILALTCR